MGWNRGFGGQGVVLTPSGGVITDPTRAAALAWATNQQGGSTDGATPPAGYGIWEAGTNLFRRGQCDSGADWAGASGHELITTDPTVPAPFSPQSIKCVTDASVANEGVLCGSNTGQAAAAGVIGTGSIYFKGVAGQSYFCKVRWVNTDATTTDGTQLTFTATGNWQQVIPASLAVAVGKTGDQILIMLRINGTRAEAYNLAHTMLQKGVNTVSPYIATSGGAIATRLNALVTAPATLVTPTLGWFAARLRIGFTSSQLVAANQACQLAQLAKDANNYISVFYRGADGSWRTRATVGGASTGDSAIVQAQNPGDLVTVIGRWTATQVAVSVNGSAFNVATPTSMPALGTTQTLTLGSFLAGGSQIDSSILWAATGIGSLKDADAAAINAYGNNPPPLTSLPALPTMSWAAVTGQSSRKSRNWNSSWRGMPS